MLRLYNESYKDLPVDLMSLFHFYVLNDVVFRANSHDV